MPLYGRIPTVADGSPDQLMVKALVSAFPPKASSSTVRLEVIVKFGAVVCRVS